MLTRIQKWGNSLGVRIPKSFADEAQMADGSTVDISVEQGVLVLRPVRLRKYALSELMDRVTSRNRHAEELAGDAIGRERW